MKRIPLAIVAWLIALGAATAAHAQTETFTNFVRSAPAGVATTTSIIPCINSNGSTYLTYKCTPPSLLSLLTSAEVATALGYTPMNGANNLSELTDTSTARINLGVTGSGGGISQIFGTTGQITASTAASVTTLSIPDPFTPPGTVSGSSYSISPTGKVFAFGESAPQVVWGGAVSPTLQILSEAPNLGLMRWNATATSGALLLANRSRGTSSGALTAVQDGDRLFTETIRGATGSGWITGGQYSVTVSGTPGASLIPTNTVISTSGDLGNNLPALFAGPNQEIVVNPSTAISTGATKGFFYLNKVAGVPTGTPLDYGNNAPLILDSTDKLLYFYQGGWNPITGGGGGGGVDQVLGTVNQVTVTTAASIATVKLPNSIQAPGSLTTTGGISSTTTVSGTGFIPEVGTILPYGLSSQAPNSLTLSVTSSPGLKIDSSGISLVNLSQAISVNNTFGQLEVAADTKKNLSLQRYAFGLAQSSGATLDFMRSRSTVIGQSTALALGDTVGQLRFAGVRTDTAFDFGADIDVTVAASPTATTIPMTMNFRTDDATAVSLLRFQIDWQGNVAVGGQTAQLSTSTSNGFFHIPNMAGTPTGTPSLISQSFDSALTVDATNNLMYFYSSGAWHSTAGSGVTSVTGTANQINSTGGTTPVLSFPTSVQFPGVESSSGISSSGVIKAASTVSGTGFIPEVGTILPYGLSSQAPNSITLSVASSPGVKIDSSGIALVNSSQAISNNNTFGQLEVFSDTKKTMSLQRYAFGAQTAQGVTLDFMRSRSTVIGQTTALALGDTIATIRFVGVDSTPLFNTGAQINVTVAASPTASPVASIPMNMSFTTTDATNTQLQRLLLDWQGNVVIGAQTAALSTAISNGFFYLPVTAGAPTGTPSIISASFNSAQVVDTTNNQLNFFSTSAWHPLGPLNVANIWTAGQSGRVSSLTDAATISIDMASGNNFESTLHGSRTLANPSNAISGQSGIIAFKQDSSGSRVLSYGSNYVSTTIPVLSTTAGATDYLTYYVQSPTAIYVSVINNIK